jgi:hypothetical protein
MYSTAVLHTVQYCTVKVSLSTCYLWSGSSARDLVSLIDCCCEFRGLVIYHLCRTSIA